MVRRTKRTRRAGVLLSAMAAAAALTLAACSSGSAPSSATGGSGAGSASAGSDAGDLKMNVMIGPGASGLAAVVAADYGIFQKHGLDVTIHTAQNTALNPSLIASGQYQVSDMPTPTFLSAVKAGQHIEAFANEYDSSPSYPFESVMVAGNSPLKSISDLKGQSIATPATNGNLWYALLYSLIKAGVPPTSVKPVVTTFANMSANLQAGRVAAAVTIPPYTGQITTAGGRVLGQPYQSIGSDVQAQLFAISPSFASAHPDAAAEFRAALSDAATFIVTHKQQALTSLEKFTGLPASVVKTVPLPDFSAINLTQDQLSTWAKVMVTVTGDKSYDSINLSSVITH